MTLNRNPNSNHSGTKLRVCRSTDESLARSGLLSLNQSHLLAGSVQPRGCARAGRHGPRASFDRLMVISFSPGKLRRQRPIIRGHDRASSGDQSGISDRPRRRNAINSVTCVANIMLRAS